MTRNQLFDAINKEVNTYLGFKSELGGMSGRSKPVLEAALAKLQRANALVAEANMIRSKYTKQQWDAAMIFGTGNTGVSEQDRECVNTRLQMASDLWLSNLWEG